MKIEHVHASYGVSKLGENIPSINLTAGSSCRPDAPCYALCYARHGRFNFSNVKTPLQRNLEIWKENPAKFEKEAAMIAYPARFFRWHSSGDIVDSAYLEMMVRVANEDKGTRFLAFTKQFEIVNAYLDEHGAFPENLTIVLSAWGDWIPENPHNLPMSYIRLKKTPCEIPEYAFECSKYCGDCVMKEKNCWAMKHGEAVVFNQH